MAIYRASMNFPMDSALPRDVVSITPHFNANDPEALVQVLHDNLNNWQGTAGKPHTIKIYDATKLPPSYPLAQREGLGTPPASTNPREVAICLSYFAVWNRPSYRGRLYLPSSWITAAIGARPSDPLLDQVLTFATQVLTKNLPPASFWTVYSRLHRSDSQVTDIWCDDEWDTVRSRGLRGTKRITQKV